jgi:hypothetical protein
MEQNKTEQILYVFYWCKFAKVSKSSAIIARIHHLFLSWNGKKHNTEDGKQSTLKEVMEVFFERNLFEINVFFLCALTCLCVGGLVQEEEKIKGKEITKQKKPGKVVF